MELNLETLEEALGILGHLILDRGQRYEIVVIGGGSLLLSGEILRTTNDLVLIALIDEDELISEEPLPIPLSKDIHDVGIALNLGQHWINTGPTNLFKKGLPEGFQTRLQTSQYGGLIVHVAGRFDQICFKLYAVAEQGQKNGLVQMKVTLSLPQSGKESVTFI
ncbi:MAG: hypothetical protein H0T62_02895 [Parachlamydiaceae bacterium]|nr:hypothetical protein [Parachlamydiaceae bacterium]